MSQLDLDPADLQKRSKDLDLREALLDQRERQLDEQAALGRIEVLSKQIEAKQEVLDKLNSKILVLDKQLSDRAEEVERELVELNSLEASKQAHLKGLDGKKAQLETDLTLIKSQLEDVNSQIGQRQAYLEQQEQEVTVAVEEWNGRLNQLRFELDNAQKDLQRSLSDRVRIDQEKDDLVDSLEEFNQKLQDIEYAYNDKAAGYRDSLRALNLEVDQKKKWLDEQTTRHTLKEQDIASREKSIEVQTVVNNRKERELTQKERKLRMDFNLAGEAYE